MKQELSKENGTKTLGELMILAGYAESCARLPSEKVLNAPVVQEAMTDFVDELEKKARMNLNAITPDKVDGATMRDNAYALDILTKNKQLLTGNATENNVLTIQISEEVAKKNA